MNIEELYNSILNNNIDMQLFGQISFEGDYIKWEYDGLGKFVADMETHLNETYEEDKEIICDHLMDNNAFDLFTFNLPESNDSFIFLHINEN